MPKPADLLVDPVPDQLAEPDERIQRPLLLDRHDSSDHLPGMDRIVGRRGGVASQDKHDVRESAASFVVREASLVRGLTRDTRYERRLPFDSDDATAQEPASGAAEQNIAASDGRRDDRLDDDAIAIVDGRKHAPACDVKADTIAVPGEIVVDI